MDDVKIDELLNVDLEKISSAGKRKNQKVRITILIVLMTVLVLSLIGKIMYQANWSVKNVGNIIGGKHFSCLWSHEYKAPNCKHGYICVNCSLEKGEKGEHDWLSANCELPKRCSVCDETDGEPIGHTTRIGKCKRCDEIIAELDPNFQSILSNISNLNNNHKKAVTLLSKKGATYGDAYIAVDYVNEGKTYLEKAIASCGDYDEFAKVKKALKEAFDLYPTGEIERLQDSYNPLLTLIDGVTECLGDALTYLNYLTEQ